MAANRWPSALLDQGNGSGRVAGLSGEFQVSIPLESTLGTLEHLVVPIGIFFIPLLTPEKMTGRFRPLILQMPFLI